jgi:MYXO-CTERM domain-containing protein
MNRILLFVLASAASLGLARLAAADVPDFFPGCAEERGHCTACVRYGYENNETFASYEKCAAEAEAGGLVDACQDRRGGGSKLTVFFCAKDFIAQRDAGRSRGCGGCSTAGGTPSAALAGLVIGALILRRRRRS